jgi:transposase
VEVFTTHLKEEGASDMQITTIGLDLAKNVFQVHAGDERGREVLRKKLHRHQMAAFFAQQPPCLVAMEACASAHHWGRKLGQYGHQVRLIAPQYVKPYVKSQKNDAADAAAICEAATRPHMRFVALKSVDQQTILAVHTVRSGFVKQRTALSNQMRGLLAEFGVVLPQGLARLRQGLLPALERQSGELTAGMRTLIGMLHEQLQRLDEQIGKLELQIRQWAQQDERSRLLQQIPGVGPITASALTASVGDARQFEDGRQMSAWLGLVPRQHSSGGKNVLLGITKRGDKYLRTLLIHGARAALKAYQRSPEKMPARLQQLLQRKHPNIVCVALASRNARVAWAMLSRGEDYRQSIPGVGNALSPALV